MPELIELHSIHMPVNDEFKRGLKVLSDNKIATEDNVSSLRLDLDFKQSYSMARILVELHQTNNLTPENRLSLEKNRDYAAELQASFEHVNRQYLQSSTPERKKRIYRMLLQQGRNSEQLDRVLRLGAHDSLPDSLFDQMEKNPNEMFSYAKNYRETCVSVKTLTSVNHNEELVHQAKNLGEIKYSLDTVYYSTQTIKAYKNTVNRQFAYDVIQGLHEAFVSMVIHAGANARLVGDDIQYFIIRFSAFGRGIGAGLTDEPKQQVITVLNEFLKPFIAHPEKFKKASELFDQLNSAGLITLQNMERLNVLLEDHLEDFVRVFTPSQNLSQTKFDNVIRQIEIQAHNVQLSAFPILFMRANGNNDFAKKHVLETSARVRNFIFG